MREPWLVLVPTWPRTDVLSGSPGMSPACTYRAYSNWSLATYPFFSSSKPQQWCTWLLYMATRPTCWMGSNLDSNQQPQAWEPGVVKIDHTLHRHSLKNKRKHRVLGSKGSIIVQSLLAQSALDVYVCYLMWLLCMQCNRYFTHVIKDQSKILYTYLLQAGYII